MGTMVNYRTAEIRRLAPRANAAREWGIAIMLGTAAFAVLKGVGVFETSSEGLFLAGGAGFLVFLIGRVWMGVLDARLARKINEAEG